MVFYPADVSVSVIAFHGSGAWPDLLRHDMGDPLWVTHYAKGYDLTASIDLIRKEKEAGKRVVLMGYSKGGSHIADLTHFISIDAAVLYESPNFGNVTPSGSFPVLMAWNDRGRKNWPESRRTIAEWKINHPVDMVRGVGRHVRWSPRWPWLHHAWDQELNPFLLDWIMRAIMDSQSIPDRSLEINLRDFFTA